MMTRVVMPLAAPSEHEISRYLVQTSKLRQSDPKRPVCRGWSDFDLREE
jgi:hypothetical protein